MRSILFAALIATLPAAGALAQGMPSMPSGDFPQPGTFCGPFTLCQPDSVTVTRGASR